MTDLAGTVRQALASKDDTSDISNTRVVIDTSVLIADPACLHSMGEADVVIPLTVIEELDGLKSRSDDVGHEQKPAYDGKKPSHERGYRLEKYLGLHRDR